MIKNIFIDLDETILDFRMAESVAISKTLVEFGIEPTEEIIDLYSSINKGQWKLLEKEEITRDEVLTGRFRLFFSQLGVLRSEDDARKTYEKLLGEGHYFIDGAKELLESLYKKYDLYLASNGIAKVQDGRIASADIAKYFKRIFISEKVGFDKPNVQFFERCFESIDGFSREECMIIGDSLSSDIKGGNNAGILTCWFNPHGESRVKGITVDYEVSALDQIPALLDSLM